MKILALLSILVSLQAHSFSKTDRNNPDSQTQIVLGFLGHNPIVPLQFPCLLVYGKLNCDPDYIRMNSSVCLRTLHYEKNINNQYIVSCNTSLSQKIVLGMSRPGERPANGYLHLQLNPKLKLENVMMPRQSGFGYFQIDLIK